MCLNYPCCCVTEIDQISVSTFCVICSFYWHHCLVNIQKKRFKNTHSDNCRARWQNVREQTERHAKTMGVRNVIAFTVLHTMHRGFVKQHLSVSLVCAVGTGYAIACPVCLHDRWLYVCVRSQPERLEWLHGSSCWTYSKLFSYSFKVTETQRNRGREGERDTPRMNALTEQHLGSRVILACIQQAKHHPAVCMWYTVTY